jgi:hypothetical protein
MVFARSPYQSEPLQNDAVSYTFSGENVFYLRETARAGRYLHQDWRTLFLTIAGDAPDG